MPGIISWPNGLAEAGVVPGTVSAEPIIGSDVFPTMLEAAGIAIPDDKTLDSASILPVLQGQPFERGKPLFWRNVYDQFRVAIRDGQWKLVADAQRQTFALYNMHIDQLETADLSKQYPEVFERMKAALIAYDRDVLAEAPKDWWAKEVKMGLDTLHELD